MFAGSYTFQRYITVGSHSEPFNFSAKISFLVKPFTVITSEPQNQSVGTEYDPLDCPHPWVHLYVLAHTRPHHLLPVLENVVQAMGRPSGRGPKCCRPQSRLSGCSRIVKDGRNHLDTPVHHYRTLMARHIIPPASDRPTASERHAP